MPKKIKKVGAEKLEEDFKKALANQKANIETDEFLAGYKGFGGTYSNVQSSYHMHSNGFYCGFNMPDALESKWRGDEEIAHGLPPYNQRKSFLVDEYPACPDNWLRSEGSTTSYFVPVQESSGMWLDFNKNGENTHHLAIVISIQGVNPLTGLPCNDAQLEQYVEKCPKHKTKFGANRFCKKCDFKWPKQNYISTTGSPDGSLWLDGFRAVDGVVRQYILSEEKMRGVASNVIGEDRVFAVGISYFLSKDQKPQKEIIRETINYSSDMIKTFAPPIQITTETKYGGTGMLGLCSTDTVKGITPTPQATSSSSHKIAGASEGPTKMFSKGTKMSKSKSKSSDEVSHASLSRKRKSSGGGASAVLDSGPISPEGRIGGGATKGGGGTKSSKAQYDSAKISTNSVYPSAAAGGGDAAGSEESWEDAEVDIMSYASDPNSFLRHAEISDGVLSSLESENTFKSVDRVEKVTIKKLEVGAGAKIKQSIHNDPEPLDFWREEPEAIICINYCSEAEGNKIIEQGKVNVEGSKEGYLEKIPVGN